ncbi:hypothetical protein [Sigmofec virus UA08Rod_6476]|uniref:Uncharacterized protein n=1 Tax=Sigmofec virus UA08Rod_6476 TaxID=2929231 RepID=A0A976N0Y9_9VIRU|nr:hypothetical protein [Sigmofec virus UA08Rod_6476]
MIDQLLDYIPILISFISGISAVLSAFYMRARGKSIDTEVKSMYSYLKPDDKKKVVTQTFSPLVTQYRLNKVTGELEEVDEKLDVDKLIASHMDSTLHAMLDKYTPIEVTDEIEGRIYGIEDKLLSLTDALNTLEDVRDELKLGDKASITEVYEALEQQRAAELGLLKQQQAAKLEKPKAPTLDERLEALNKQLDELKAAASKPAGDDNA